MSPLSTAPLKALLVDPAYFTPPYDAALSEGLEHVGVRCEWVTRPPRTGEADTDSLPGRLELFYRGDAAASVKHAGLSSKLRKGLSHLAGVRRLLDHVRTRRPDVVHLQWAVVPIVDRLWMRRLRPRVPIVFTVHDLTPFNASASSRLQTLGFQGVLREASALIVHTRSARDTLLGEGLEPSRVIHIPHGPLRLAGAVPSRAPVWSPDRRSRIVLFGKLQPYKGVDVLVEALGRLAPSVRARLEVIVAGEALMDVAQLQLRIVQLGLDKVIDLRLGRVSDAEAHALLDSADAYVFPYREIEASGVLYLVAGYGRWIIASALGAFREVVKPQVDGALVEPGNAEALASAIQASIGQAPRDASAGALMSWGAIGEETRTVYANLARRRREG